MKQYTASSLGKVIVSGEHSVVYGELALVGRLSLKIVVHVKQKINNQQSLSNKITKKGKQANGLVKHLTTVFEKKYGKNAAGLEITIEGDLPQKSGLGSSAALSHAIFKALLAWFGIEVSVRDMFLLVMAGEEYAHSNPSGVDAAAVVHGGMLQFRRQGESHHYYQVNLPQLAQRRFFLINSGQAEETTAEMVEQVAQLPSRIRKRTIAAIGRLTTELLDKLKQGVFDYKLLTANQYLLEELGVVSSKAAGMADIIEQADGAAKVTGAGGVKKGSGFLLAYHPVSSRLQSLIKQHHWQARPVQIGAI